MNDYENEIVVGLGEILWDIPPDGKQLGGAPMNFAYHASKCGFKGYAVSAIGDDELGREAVAALDGKKLNYILETVDYPTGTVPITLSETGVPTYEIKEGVAWDNMPFNSRMEVLAGKTRAVCFGSLAQRSSVSRESINRFLDAIPKDDKRYIVFDVNLRQNFYNEDILRESMQRCNVMKINDEELVQVERMFGYPGLDLENTCWLLLGKYNLKILVLTCGVNGSYVFTPGGKSFLPTPKVEVVDTIGAGDSFSAVFIASVMRGCSIADAHQNAVNVSAFVCTQSGPMPDIPDSLKKTVPVLA